MASGVNNPYFAAYQKHYRILEKALPMDKLYPTLVSNGLLSDVALQQSISAATTDVAKARLFLDSLRNGLQIGVNDTFVKFLDALTQYADRNGDRVVKKIVDDVRQDLPDAPNYGSEHPSSPGRKTGEMVSNKLNACPVDVDKLKARYRHAQLFLTAKADWLEHTVRSYVPLAIVEKEGIIRNDENLNEITKLTLRGSVDLILKKKVQIHDLSEIFCYQGQPCPRLILIMGGPGIGKTTLANKICVKWAEDGFLCEMFDAVIMIPLRLVQKKKSLEDVMIEYIGEDSFKQLKKSGGARCLMILDGLDEMHFDHQKNDPLFLRLIKPDCTMLEKSTIAITSRPHSCERIKADRQVEVIGFGPDAIKDFVEKSFLGDKEAVSEFHHQLAERPHLHGLCYVPMNLVMIVNIFKFPTKELPTKELPTKELPTKELSTKELQTKELPTKELPTKELPTKELPTKELPTNELPTNQLPATLTSLYSLFVLMSLKRQVEKGDVNCVRLPLEFTADIRAMLHYVLGDIPSATIGTVYLLCKLASFGFDWCSDEVDGWFRNKDPRIVFTMEDLESCKIELANNSDCFGLLKATHVRDITTASSVFSFAHFTIQEFLASIYISLKPQQEQQRLLNIYFKTYPNVFTFLCGVTGLRHVEMYNSIHLKLTSRDDVVVALRCIYEAKCKASSAAPFTLDMSYEPLLAYDCLCVSYFLSSYPVSQLKMRSCQMEDKGAKMLLKHAFKSSLLELVDFSWNNLTADGMPNVMNIVTRSSATLRELNVSSNKIGDDMVSVIAQHLRDNNVLKNLNVSKCGLSVRGAGYLGELFKFNNSLKELVVGDNQIGDEGVLSVCKGLQTLTMLDIRQCGLSAKGATHIKEALKENQTLLRLWMGENKIGDVGIAEIATTLNSCTVSLLDVQSCGITREGVKHLSSTLSTNKSIRELCLYGNDIKVDGAQLITQAAVDNEICEYVQIDFECKNDDVKKLSRILRNRQKGKKQKSLEWRTVPKTTEIDNTRSDT